MSAMMRKFRQLLNLARLRSDVIDDPQGQILGDTPMGTWLKALVFDPEVRHVVEIGTWKGLGSTILLHAAALQRPERPKVMSLEANAEFFHIARKTSRTMGS